MNSVMSIGFQGMQKGFRQLNESAQSIANSNLKTTTSQPNQPGQDLTTASVDLIAAELQVSASAKVVEAGDRTLGSLLDLKV